MNIFKYIDPFYFFMAFVIGLILTYLLTPVPTLIIKYPTPENAGKFIYKDKADVCYKYAAEEVSCPTDESMIKEIPIQDGKSGGVIDRLFRK